jgi:TolB protein
MSKELFANLARAWILASLQTESDEAGDRRIAIHDIAKGNSSLVEGIPGKNEFMPIWSPNGKSIFFNHFGESDWLFASVDAAGGNFKIINADAKQKVATAGPFLNSDEWLCHDMESFYILKSNGEVKALPKADKPVNLSMPSWISVSPDGKTALFEMAVEEEADPDDGYMPNAVFQIDISTGKITRITPKGVEASHPSWLPNGTEFLFGGFDKKTSQPAIYRMSLEKDADPILVQENASSPTVAWNEPQHASQTATYVKCILYAGSAQLVFTDENGAEFQAGVMTKAQRTGMAPDEPYVKFPEEMIDVNAKDGSDTNAKLVGKKFLLKKDASGSVIEITQTK